MKTTQDFRAWNQKCGSCPSSAGTLLRLKHGTYLHSAISLLSPTYKDLEAAADKGYTVV